MQTTLTDIYNARPEQLSSFDTFINYTSTGIIAGAIGFPLEFNRVYTITKIKSCISLFRKSDDTLQAFPNFEQFQLPLAMRAEIADAASHKTTTLFNELRDVYTDGTMHSHTFETPFDVIVNQRQGSQILVTISVDGNAQSLADTVGSLSTGVPTAPAVCFADGLLIFEGYSMPIDAYNKIKQRVKIQ